MAETLLESIFIKNGEIQNLAFHQARLEASLKELYPKARPINLHEEIETQYARFAEVKCRILYTSKITGMEFLAYERKIISTLQVVETQMDYSHKYENRTEIIELADSQKKQANDILMLKNGLITDSSYANILFKTPNKELLTPALPLLPGTMRAKLLAEQKIKPATIAISDLSNFTHFALVNAFWDLDAVSWQPVENIFI
jgi:4-amino-4-deoxychorismate lyase